MLESFSDLGRTEQTVPLAPLRVTHATSIPPRKSVPTPEPPDHGERVPISERHYREALRQAVALIAERGGYATVRYPVTSDPGTVYRGLRKAREGGGAAVAIVQRGSRVYVTPRPPAARYTGADIESMILGVSEGESVTVDTSALTDAETRALYAALQYRRTRIGYGGVRVALARDGSTITLTDTL